MAEIKMMISPHAGEAKVVLETIRGVRAQIPRLTTVGLAEGRRLSARIGVPDDFVESVSVLVETSARLAQAAEVNATTLRDSYGYALAYEPVVQELLALAAIMAHTIRVQKAEAAAAALDVYAIAQRVSKQKGAAELIPHVKDMANKLHKKRTRKPVAEPDVIPVPQVK